MLKNEDEIEICLKGATISGKTWLWKKYEKKRKKYEKKYEKVWKSMKKYEKYEKIWKAPPFLGTLGCEDENISPTCLSKTELAANNTTPFVA